MGNFFNVRFASVSTALIACSLLMQGCTATTGGNHVVGQTAMDNAIGNCIGGMLVSAGVGAVVGAAIGGSRGAERGAIIGAVGGAGRCAVLIELAAREDRERARNAEIAAIRSGSTRSKTISTSNGKRVNVRTVVTPAPVPEKLKPEAKPKDAVVQAPTGVQEPKVTYSTCRRAENTVSANGASASAGSQLWCRTQTGDWEPIAL